MNSGGIYEGNGSPLRAVKQNRNAQCACGSGKKAKQCCGESLQYYHTSADPGNERRIKANEALLKKAINSGRKELAVILRKRIIELKNQQANDLERPTGSDQATNA